MKQVNKIASLVAISFYLVISAVATGCGSTESANTAATGSSTSTAASTASTLFMSPSSVTLTEGEAYSFMASGGSGSGYVYSLASGGSVAGTITTYGYFVAANNWTGTTYVIVTDSLGNEATSVVTITSSTGSTSTGAAIALSPSSVFLIEGEYSTFAASGGSGSYTYSVPSGEGVINSSTGLYEAPASFIGTTYVEVKDSEGNMTTASVTVTSSSSGTTTTSTVLSMTGTLLNCTGVSGGSGNKNNWQVNTGLLRTINDANNYTESPVYCTGLSVAGEIPSTATIQGVSVSVYIINQSSKTDGSLLQTLNLINSSALVGSPKDLNLAIPGNTATTFPTFSEGGSADAWGAALTPAIVNSSSFGIDIQTYRGSDRLFTGDETGNLPQVTIYYTL